MRKERIEREMILVALALGILKDNERMEVIRLFPFSFFSSMNESGFCMYVVAVIYWQENERK